MQTKLGSPFGWLSQKTGQSSGQRGLPSPRKPPSFEESTCPSRSPQRRCNKGYGATEERLLSPGVWLQ